jgi:uncharacterized protein (DUF362 family)
MPQRHMAATRESLVAMARSLGPYGPASVPAPELPGSTTSTVAQACLRKLLLSLKLDAAHAGTPVWNPLGAIVRPGYKVVVKPNLVLHRNESGFGLDCLITHASVIEAVLDYLMLARPASVIVGDAPVQGCDFEILRRKSNLESIIECFRRRGLDVELRDFRRSILLGEKPGAERIVDRRPMGEYVLFDLKSDSLLEHLAGDAHKFRVTMYNPDLLRRTHAPGRHQYLIAREIVEADTVINLPKLKTHKKSCITGALKNLVGINGSKEYLPHHRKGGSGDGGDCYRGRSWLKRRVEDLLDFTNRAEAAASRSALWATANCLLRVAGRVGPDDNIEGSWFGNDTIWRTVLDLQRILHYGTVGGRLERVQQRAVFHLTDAIIAGEGEGPLASRPVAAQFMTASFNGAAADWVHSRLMGYDPKKIPLVLHGFDRFDYPLAEFAPSEIEVVEGSETVSGSEINPRRGYVFLPPGGWQGHCELESYVDDHQQAILA